MSEETHLYNIEFQRSVVKLICDTPEFYILNSDLLRTSYFETSMLRSLFNLITTHIDYFLGRSISANEMFVLAKEQLLPAISSDPSMVDEIYAIFHTDASNRTYIVDRVSEFCRRRALREALTKIVDKLETNFDPDYVVKLISDAAMIGINHKKGFTGKDIYDLPEMYKVKYATTSLIKTGFSKFDRALQGGMGGGELHTIIGGPKPWLRGTKIPLLNGKEIEIQDLVGLEEFWVYSCTPEGQIVPGRGHSCHLSRETTEIIELELDNGEFIRTTFDHEHMMRDGTYRMVNDIKIGDSLMPFYSGKGDKVLPHMMEEYQTIFDNKSNTWNFVHWMVGDYFNPLRFSENKSIIHHIDLDIYNNSPNNLFACSGEQHKDLHRDAWSKNMQAIWDDENHPIHEAHAKEISERNTKRWTTDQEYREYMEEVLARGRATQIESGQMDEIRSRGGVTVTSDPILSKKLWDSVRQYHKDNPDKQSAIGTASCKKLHQDPGYQKEHAERASNRMRDPEVQYRCQRTKNLNKAREWYIQCGDIDKVIEGYKKNLPHQVPKYYESWDEFKELILDKINHKVVGKRIITYENTVPVYCFSVDKYHNFAVSAGIFTHNTGKSTFAASVGSYSCMLGKVVYHATLEISALDVLAKYYLRVTGNRYEDIIMDLDMDKDALIRKYSRMPMIDGRLFIQHWEEKSGTTSDIKSWISRTINSGNPTPDLIIVDYDDDILGDTKIPLLNGTEKTIAELYTEYNKTKEPIWLYACKEDGTIVPGKAHNVRTRKVSELVKITLDNGECIKSTIWHNHMLRDGTYKRADEFVVGDSLMPLYKNVDECGYDNVLVVAVEHIKLDIPESVYCLTVDDYHNYALSAGIFTHNCLNPTIKTGGDDLYGTSGQIYTDLIQLACYFNVPVLTFSQPTREAWGLYAATDKYVTAGYISHSARKVHKCWSISSLNFKSNSDTDGYLYLDICRRGLSNVAIPIKRDMARSSFNECGGN